MLYPLAGAVQLLIPKPEEAKEITTRREEESEVKNIEAKSGCGDRCSSVPLLKGNQW